ncbi:hypothetical protein BGZ61DRAFT_511848 [Ilyonectria robusta]|uniref:uncharacterized protein n=1 Tax=Ilyonectria robusta TaxID=1079257 RepID=UPI001E8E07F5|nr:uncharacterized protein BGZ61DRAFT_511848 [Ilyonectria robusta]KAH8737196.1 hypothetical protein BGZ61DRAFT_511848 [Ilyonectria robusta]
MASHLPLPDSFYPPARQPSRLQSTSSDCHPPAATSLALSGQQGLWRRRVAEPSFRLSWRDGGVLHAAHLPCLKHVSHPTFSRVSENNISIGKHAQRIIDTSWNTRPNTHTRITREAPGIDSEANAGRGRWTWGLVGEIAAKKAGAVPGGPVYLQLHMDASTPMQYPILRMGPDIAVARRDFENLFMGGGARGHRFVQMKATGHHRAQSPVARGADGKSHLLVITGPVLAWRGRFLKLFGASRGVMGPRTEARLPGTSQLDTGRLDVVICTGDIGFAQTPDVACCSAMLSNPVAPQSPANGLRNSSRALLGSGGQVEADDDADGGQLTGGRIAVAKAATTSTVTPKNSGARTLAR